MTTLVQAIVGSQTYGLATESSDEDRLGVFAHPINELIGLFESTQTIAQKNPDITVHELGKFANLCLKSNPTVSELLWATPIPGLTHSAWSEHILPIRQNFLSTNYVRNAYGGYAYHQLRKATDGLIKGEERKNPRRLEKLGRHAARLVMAGQELLDTGELRLDVSEDRDYLFEMGKLVVSDPSEFQTRFEKELNILDTIDSVLPDKPDYAKVEQAVLAVRWELHGEV